MRTFRALTGLMLLPALVSASLAAAPFAAPAPDTAELILANQNLRAVFSNRGLASLLDVRTGAKIVFTELLGADVP